LEKSTDAKNYLTKVQVPRLEALQIVSEHYNSDPYTLSLKVRKRFREEKKLENERTAADNEIKTRYALPELLSLAADDDEVKAEAKREWHRGQQEIRLKNSLKRQKLRSNQFASTSRPPSRSSAASSLRTQVLENTARKISSRPKHL